MQADKQRLFDLEEDFLRQYSDPLRAYEEIVLPRKLALSLSYLQWRCLRDDVRLLLLTALTALRFRRRGSPYSQKIFDMKYGA